MQHLRRSTLSRTVAYIVAASLLAPQVFLCLPQVSAQTMKQVTAVAVLPFTDLSGSGKSFVSRDMTAAAALALEDTREFTVTSTADLEREMNSMRLRVPLSMAEQIRLGQRLGVDKVLVGEIASLKVDARSGRTSIEVRLMLLDVAVGEYLDGSISALTTKALPGWSGDVNQALDDAMREAGEDAVAKMLSARVRRGNVDMVDDQGNVNISLGADSGLTPDADLLVMRPQWQPDLEKSILRRVGRIRVSDLESNMSVCGVVEGAMPTGGDKVYRIYKPAAVAAKEARSRSIKKTGQLAAGLLLLVGLLGVVGGPNTSSASSVSACLSQSQPGDSPVMRLTVTTGNTAREQTHGYLIFRAANNPDFAASADYLIEAIAGKDLTYYSDEAATLRVVDDFEINFQYKNDSGDYTDGSCTVSYNDNPLSVGSRYYYRVRRVTDPLYPPGTNPPISASQTLATPTITPTPDWRIISTQSNAAGPLTYFLPPTASTPVDGASNQLTTDVEFSWQPTTGANEYVVQVFASSDPDGLHAPLYQSAVQRDTGSSLMSVTMAGPFAAQTTYWWRVGARNSGDAVMPENQMTGVKAWLYSTPRSFTTAAQPPQPPTTSGVSPRVPSAHRGFFGGDARSRRR